MFVQSAIAQDVTAEPAPVEGGSPLGEPSLTGEPAPVAAPPPTDAAAPVDAGSPDEHAAPAGADAHEPGAAGDLHEGVETEHSSGLFPPFDPGTFPSQLLWLAITFGLFYLFLKNVLLPRIGNILEVRGNRIAADLGEAGRLKSEADAAMAAYEQNLSEARGKANVIAQEARDAARADAEGHRKRVEGELDARLESAETRIAGIKSAAMTEVGSIAEETAAAIVQRLLGSGADRTAVANAVQAARG